MNRYRINSDYGRFDAYGDLMLALRVQEIGALGELDEVSKAEVFAESALSAALRPVSAIVIDYQVIIKKEYSSIIRL